MAFPYTPTRRIAFLPFKMWLTAFLPGKPPLTQSPTPDQGPLSIFSTWRSPPHQSYQAASCPLDCGLLEGRGEFCIVSAQSLAPNMRFRKIN